MGPVLREEDPVLREVKGSGLREEEETRTEEEARICGQSIYVTSSGKKKRKARYNNILWNKANRLQ